MPQQLGFFYKDGLAATRCKLCLQLTSEPHHPRCTAGRLLAVLETAPPRATVSAKVYAALLDILEAENFSL